MTSAREMRKQADERRRQEAWENLFHVGQRVHCVTFARTNVFGVILDIRRGAYKASANVRIDSFHADGAPLYTLIDLDDLEPAEKKVL